MVELVDALASGASRSNPVRVRVSLSPQGKKSKCPDGGIGIRASLRN